MLKLIRRLLFLGLLAAGGYALWKKLAGSGTAAAPPAAENEAASPVWVESDDGACPISHPVKGKVTSGIFHVPGGQAYERTRADRCYADSIAAEADGMRQAKR